MGKWHRRLGHQMGINGMRLGINGHLTADIGGHSRIALSTRNAVQVLMFAMNPLERATRIELAFSAWEADVLPLNYTRVEYIVLREGPSTVNCEKVAGVIVGAE